MSLEIDVLRALLRLARRRKNPTLGDLVARVGVDDETALRRALAALARGGLVERSPSGIRLSLAGLAVAVAVASAPRPRAAVTDRPVARAIRPAARRRRAA
jgi:DNA-binding IclR family transcriptional regulator